MMQDENKEVGCQGELKSKGNIRECDGDGMCHRLGGARDSAMDTSRRDGNKVGNVVPGDKIASRGNRVAYVYDPDIGQFYYGQGHPMKPHRVRMAHSLIMHYGLYERMDCFRPARASRGDMVSFHREDYVDFLSTVTTRDAMKRSNVLQQLKAFNMLDDCPVFDGVWEYSQISAGGTIGGAVKINRGEADVVINWAGGLHHGKKSEASGFCYINDIVLGILELLKYHQRVLYVDIDVHHGDGVEEAFLTTNRVMTLSFHKFGDGFFPRTGNIMNVGHGEGKYYSLNIPLRDGIGDASYTLLFEKVVSKVVEVYDPEVIVLQCGADSLAHDRLGVFNLSSKGHGKCVEIVKALGRPVLLLGGGGYTINNVARCWAQETAIALGTMLDESIPPSEYYEYFGPEFRLQVDPIMDTSMADKNDLQYMENILEKVHTYLGHVVPVPSVAFHTRAPDSRQQIVPVKEDGKDVVQSPRKPPQQMWMH